MCLAIKEDLPFILFSAVVKSLKDEAEEEEDFPSHVKQERADHNTEEVRATQTT